MSNTDMNMTINDIRRENLLILLAETGEKKKDFAEKVETRATYLSAILGKDPEKRRDMGNDLARRIEAIYNKPVGWMDAKHSEGDIPFTQQKGPDEMERHLVMIYRCCKHAIQVVGKPITPSSFLKRYKHALDVAFESSITEDHLKAVLTVLFAADNVSD